MSVAKCVLCGRELDDALRCRGCQRDEDQCSCEPLEERTPVRLLVSGDESTGTPSPSPKRRRSARQDEVLPADVGDVAKPTSIALDSRTKALLAEEAGKRGMSRSSLVRAMLLALRAGRTRL